MEHGGKTMYRRGCRCDLCRAYNAAEQRKFTAKYRRENGTTYRHNFKPADGHEQQWIDRPSRLALYDRDAWTCQACGIITSEAAERVGDRPSLDHILPRSKGGSHDPANLQLLCRSCNSRKKDRLPEADQED